MLIPALRVNSDSPGEYRLEKINMNLLMSVGVSLESFALIHIVPRFAIKRAEYYYLFHILITIIPSAL